MKTFKQFITEQEYTLQQNVERLKNRRQNQDAFLSGKIGLKDIDKPFGSSTKSKPDVSQPSSVDYTGSRYDLGGGQSIDPSSISNKPIARPDKAYTSGKFNTALAAAGYDQSGKKITAIPKQTGVEKANISLPSKPKKIVATYVAHPDYTTKMQDRVPGTYRSSKDDMKKASPSKEYSGSSYPNMRQAKGSKSVGTDTNIKFANIMKKINIPSSIQKEPAVKPKVGSLAVSQSGYPAAKKTQLAPAETQKASSGGSYKIKSGDNPTRIAKSLGMTLDQLEKKNPGILKRARRLKPGETVNR